MREESNAATEKYKKSVERGRATTVEEGWELLSQLNKSKRMRTQRRYSMMCSGTPQSSRVTGANMLMHRGQATGLQFAGTPYQRPAGSMQQGFRAPRAPTMPQQHLPRMPQYPPQRQTLCSSPAQWSGRNAVPHGVYVQQRGGTSQQPAPKMPISGALSQGPASQQSQTMQRWMQPQQQQLASSDSGYWKNTDATPNRMASQRGTIGQHQQVPHVGAHFAANNQVRPPAQHQFTDTKNATPSYANNGGYSSVFHTPNADDATPIGMRSQNQYASDSMQLQRFAAGNSSAQQNNPLQGVYNADIFNRPTSKPVNSWSAATGQQAMPRNNAYVAQPQRQAVDASDFFSLSEQELDEVLASLADSKTTSQHRTPSTNATFSAATSQEAQFIPQPGAGLMEHPSSAASGYGTVTNASQGNVATSTFPATGAQAIHISMPTGAQVLEIRESSMHPGAYEVVTTAGTFTAYGKTQAAHQQR